jgi:hypothetical protein
VEIMKVRVFSDELIEKTNGIPRGSILSAKRILNNINIDYVTGKHIGFTCMDPRFNISHSVIYFSEKRFKDAWNCDCKWFSLKRRFCKHILGVFIRVNSDKSFLRDVDIKIYK